MIVVNTLAPLVLITALGWVLERFRFARGGFFRETNRLVFWIALPCLLFAKTARPMKNLDAAMRVFIVLLAGMLLCIAIGYGLARLLKLGRSSAAALVQGAYRGNLAYVGLPIVLFGLAEKGIAGTGTEGMAFLVIAPLIPLYNAAAVFILVMGQDHPSGRLKTRLTQVLVKSFTNPLLLAVVAGLLFSMTGLTLAPSVSRTLEGIGQMALPLALLGIGAALDFATLKRNLVPALSAAAVKVGAAPLFGLLLGSALSLTAQERFIAMLYLACPTAIASFLMAEQMDSDADLANGIVVATMLMAVVSFGLVLAFG